MKFIITTDLHFTDKARDAYRFELFSWLRKQQKKHNPTATLILGDLTEKKDRHSSALVNKVVSELVTLAPPVYILRGNHDGNDPQNPFFKFLRQIDGLRFIIDPTFLPDLGLAMIPHCGTQGEFEQACRVIPSKCPMVTLHVTLEGSIAESGSRLAGLRASPIELLRPGRVWAGDVHKPQRVGCVEYVGAPYHVRFGDQYEPRVVLQEGNKVTNLHFDAPYKLNLTISKADDLLKVPDIQTGDQIKVTVDLPAEQAVEWRKIKAEVLKTCQQLGLEVFGVNVTVRSAKTDGKIKKQRLALTHKEIVLNYSKYEGLSSQVTEAGVALVS